MLWFAKQAKSEGAGDDGQTIKPATLEVQFDKEIAGSKLDGLLSVAEGRGGAQVITDALLAKNTLFAKALPSEGPVDLSREALDTLIECVFTARRKLSGVLAPMPWEPLLQAVNDLVYGKGPLTERMQAFAAVIPQEQKKARRAMWDLGAELLHFRDPEGIPLMTRWIWDPSTSTGSLREFIRANDTMETIPLDTRPETFEGVRIWFAQMLEERGFYKDIPFLIDLLQAQAYSDYVKAMSSRIGMINREFGGQEDALELPLKLLGIGVRVRDIKALRSDVNDPTLH